MKNTTSKHKYYITGSAVEDKVYYYFTMIPKE